MKFGGGQCGELEAFLDGRLEGEDRLGFETHLVGCDNCREEAEAWRTVKKEYACWVDRIMSDEAAGGQKIEASRFAASLLESTAAEKPFPQTTIRGIPRRYHFSAAAAALVGLAAVLYFMTDKRQSESNLQGTDAPPVQQPVISVTTIADGVKTNRLVPAGPDRLIEAPKNGRVLATMGQDRFGLSGLGEIRVTKITSEQTAIRLIRGGAAFSVSPRIRNARFIVTAGEVTVEVVGTRFAVAIDDTQSVTVWVQEGTVLVLAENRRIPLKEGTSITVRGGVASPPTPAGAEEMETLTALLKEEVSGTDDRNGEEVNSLSEREISSIREPRAPASPPKPLRPQKNVDAWRDLILGGEVQEAEQEIRAFLKKSPEDADSLMLLATCQKRRNQYKDAVETYKRIVVSGDESVANRARYLAAELSYSELNDLNNAVALIDDYLKYSPQSTPNRADARLMQAKALLGMGEQVRAERVLEEIVADYGRTPIANRARELLAELPGAMKPKE
jgi:TolA-binding protein